MLVGVGERIRAPGRPVSAGHLEAQWGQGRKADAAGGTHGRATNHTVEFAGTVVIGEKHGRPTRSCSQHHRKVYRKKIYPKGLLLVMFLECMCDAHEQRGLRKAISLSCSTSLAMFPRDKASF